MKNKRWHSYIWMILCMGSLLMVTPVSGTIWAQEVDGYWELISVDVEEATEPAVFYSYNISRGTGTFRAESNGETFQASMTWTEPGQRYAGGQSIDLTISVKIDEYIWDDDEPGYINQGLNYMAANISARIDQPGIGSGGVTGGAISLTDPQGEYSAKVNTDYGKIVVGSQTLQVSAIFPSGGSDGDKKSIYVNCTAGMNRYNYQWVEKASAGLEATPLPTETPLSSPTPERTVTLQGTIYALNPAWQPLDNAVFVPVIEVPVTLMRGSKVLGRTISQPPDGRFEFQAPVTDDLVIRTELQHAATNPPVFRVVYDQSDPPIWIETQPFDLDEDSPDPFVKHLNLSLPEELTSGPVPVPDARLDDVGMLYHYAREAWQMGAILLDQTFDLPELRIRAFSTSPDAQGSAYWRGPNTGFEPIDPIIEISPTYSDFSSSAAADTVMHEFGHHVMADAYANFLPLAPGDNNHFGFTNPTTTDSWVEGFATFYSVWTKRDQIQAVAPQLWHNLNTVDNLELNWLAWSAVEENAVSSLLWDLVDPVNRWDATEMPVANWATQPVITETGSTTSYGDYIQLSRDEVWRLLADVTLAAADRPPSAPPSYNYIFDVKQLYDTLTANGVGLTLPATPNGLDAVDELFIAHGFFADTNPQNLAWDPGEEIGVTNNQPITVGSDTYPARATRRSPPPIADSYFSYGVQDAGTGANLDVTDFEVTVTFDAPYESYNYSYTTRAWPAGQLPYAAPPAYYRASTSIIAAGPAVESSTSLDFSNDRYWQMRAEHPTGSLMKVTFEIEVAEDTGVGDGGGSGEVRDPRSPILAFIRDFTVPILCCAGGGGMLLISVVMLLGISVRKKGTGALPVQDGAGWQLLGIAGPGAGQRYPLGLQTSLGRDRDNTIWLDDARVSRRHALFQQTGEGYVLQDLGSSNGTWVNGQRIGQPVAVRSGDQVQIGGTVLQIITG